MSASNQQKAHLLIRFRKPKPLDRSYNIFEGQHDVVPDEDKLQPRRYSFVGDNRTVNKLMDNYSQAHPSQPPTTSDIPEVSEKLRPFGESYSDMQQRLMNTTHQRSMLADTLISKLSKHQQLSLTKQKRNMDKLGSFQNYWKSKNYGSVRTRSLSIQSDNSSRPNCRVYAEDNPNQLQALNVDPNNYWKKSLRNHNPQLLRYIRGVPLGKVQLQELLQTQKGRKFVQSKVPSIDMMVVDKLEHEGGLVLVGKSKYESQFSSSASQQLSQSYFKKQKYPSHLDQIFKVDWSYRDLARKHMPILPKMPQHIQGPI